MGQSIVLDKHEIVVDREEWEELNKSHDVLVEALIEAKDALYEGINTRRRINISKAWHTVSDALKLVGAE